MRRTLAGEFVCVSRHLLSDLVKAKLWNDELKNQLIAHNGSVQNIPIIPADLKALYKTVWEISGKTLIDMAADRGAYIDQSQSFNVHMTNVNFAKLTSMHFYAWKKGLKTGMYYLRTKAAADAIKFTVDQAQLTATVQKEVLVASNLAAEKKRDAEAAASFIALSPVAPSVVAVEASIASMSLITPTSDAELDEAEARRALRKQQEEELICSLDNPEACMSCGS